MSRTQRIAMTALLAGALPSLASAQNAPADVRNIKPVVMLLVDTSGSMERLTDDTALPVCANNPTADADQKNRWTVTLEALTGTFSSFACREVDRSSLATSEMDYAYYLPHFEVTTAASQASDGLLDTYMHKVKFGLMTFDGVGTTLNGDTLVAWDEFVSSPFQSLSNGPQGMYSYGGNRALSFPDCIDRYGVNAGARGLGAPGGLISAGPDGATVATTNASIQTALKAIRPFGATPLAGMFSDLQEYFVLDSNVSEIGDSYYECRDRYAVLLTDSAGDANDLFRDARFNCASTDHSRCAGGLCECPYDTDHEIVAELVDDSAGAPMLDRLFIVAFNVQDPDALAELDTLSRIGAPNCDRDTDPDECGALEATTPTQLRQKLAAVVSSVSSDATSRSVPVRVDSSGNVVLNGTQYEITAGFRVGANADDPWEGLLYRQRIGCDLGLPKEFDLEETEDDLFHVKLNAQPDAKRTLLTLAAGTQAASRGRLITSEVTETAIAGDFDSKTNDKAPDGSSLAGTAPVTGTTEPGELDNIASVNIDTGLNAAYFGDTDGNGTPFEAADRDMVTDYIRGLSRPGKKLADIYHSQPVVLPPLKPGDSLQSSDERLTAARRTLLADSYPGTDGRPGVVFVGTNDGVLHAFNLEELDLGGETIDAGYEFWGFVPPALFPKMHTAAIPTHTSMFDGTPVLGDVTMPRDPQSTASPEFRTMLVSNVRGAPAFVALDVTQPELLKPLWQFSDRYMGDTVGRAAITHVTIRNGTDLEVRPVAILPGGRGEVTSATATCTLTDEQKATSGSPRTEGRCWTLEGRALYVVDLMTGSLIQRFDPRHFNAPLTGSVVAEATGLGSSKAAYVTDEDGVLWRLSMVSADPGDWRAQPVYDLFAGETFDAGRPATFPPILTEDDAGNVVVVVGTGDLDNLVDDAAHKVVSLTETRALDGGGEIDPDETMTLNWRIEMEPGESVTGPLVLFEEVVYFGTFLSEADEDNACALGNSRVYGVHFRETDPDDVTQPRPMLAADADDDGQVDDPLNLVPWENAEEDSVVLGVAITREPICAEGGPDNNPNNFITQGGVTTAVDRFRATGPATGGGYQMRAMVGGSGGTARAGSAISSIQRGLKVTSEAGVAAWASSVE
jgi:type IV pilus assembly protein PilY1